MINRAFYQMSKPEMEFHMIHKMYVALPKCAQTEKTTSLCKDDYGKSLNIYSFGPKLFLTQNYFGSNSFRPKVFGHGLHLDHNLLELIFWQKQQQQ